VTDACGALLNFGYKLAEIEATLVWRRMGVSEDLGVPHVDVQGHAGTSCDCWIWWPGPCASPGSSRTPGASCGTSHFTHGSVPVTIRLTWTMTFDAA
jgi:hypothetical protein